ncbi:hypothetical protein PCIT_b0073 [Pseudoalteromonas citrea]|uniref:Tail specific protease domain-containing protein n=2 Tax=Pseudoalteromonas citrea TaxID=43655 RepID=A0AAD4AE35_9GAMM|nr:S41 family peptidase [Pseudoalteromonas citrea]KAF7764153.1 hypothetical protein PCIT_b0073 [Pseudoalteromonas citrea]
MKTTLLSLVLLSSFLATHASASEAEKRQLLHTLKQQITQLYVMQNSIPKIIDGLSQFENSQAFTQAKDVSALLPILNETLTEFDKHLSVSKITSQPRKKGGVAKPNESWFAQLERKNFGFNHVEILPGNVGVLAFWGFSNVTEQSKQKVQALMTLLDGVDSLIIDLRENGGGDAAMVQLISSYFLDKRTHLNSFYSRDTGKTSEYWTVPIAGKKRATLPIYVLTSNATFSAAEEFTYNFKHLHRATVIGEKTKGGANPWRFVNLTNNVRVSMPVSMAINPITETNWEGVGVKPHHTIPASQALSYAHQMALQELAKTKTNIHDLNDIKSALSDVNTILK